MHTKIYVLICFVLFLSCITKESPLITYDETADGWLNVPPTEEFDTSEYTDIKIIFLLPGEKLYEAAIKLEDDFYQKLTNDEYEYFTGTIKNSEIDAYLVRSFNYAFNESGYRIYKNDKNNFFIRHRTLGSGKWKGIQKWPIIILYDGIINQIYTDYSIHR
jgi:hypothetical protein